MDATASLDHLDHADHLDALLTALANPVRRRLLDLLEVGATTAGDLAASVAITFEISTARASQHLGVLAAAGLVHVQAEGNQRWYSLIDGAADPVTAWLSSLRLSGSAAGR